MNKASTAKDLIDNIYNEINHNNLKKILLIVPESAGDIFLTTSLFRSIYETYNGFEIYLACHSQYKDILKNNPYITKTITYSPIMENQTLMEGVGNWPGLFTISIMVTILTQRYINYYNNGLTKIAFNLKYNNNAPT
jgi:hypothetical protein